MYNLLKLISCPYGRQVLELLHGVEMALAIALSSISAHVYGRQDSHTDSAQITLDNLPVCYRQYSEGS